MYIRCGYFSTLEVEVASRAGILHDRAFKTGFECCTSGGVDAHMAHRTDDANFVQIVFPQVCL